MAMASSKFSVTVLCTFDYLTSDNKKETIQKAALTRPNSYLNKPFTKVQLLSAVALAWNIYRNKKHSFYDLVALTPYHRFDPITENLYENDRAVHLSPTEKSLIKIFCRSKGQLIDPRSLVTLIWMGEDYDSKSGALRNHIYRLNKKLKYKLFEYVFPTGYRIVPHSTPISDVKTPS